jgi:hypothetical protein
MTPPVDQARPGRCVASFPDAADITAVTIRCWRRAGYRINEERKEGWLYLFIRGAQDSAVYKLVGPLFHGPRASYEGLRIA